MPDRGTSNRQEGLAYNPLLMPQQLLAMSGTYPLYPMKLNCPILIVIWTLPQKTMNSFEHPHSKQPLIAHEQQVP